jgi:hypothetical protein
LKDGLSDDRRPSLTPENLCEQAGRPELFDDNLTKAAASKLIDKMREKDHIE